MIKIGVNPSNIRVCAIFMQYSKIVKNYNLKILDKYFKIIEVLQSLIKHGQSEYKIR